MGKSLIDFPLSKYTPIKSDVSASPAFFGWLMLQLALHVCYHEQYCQKGSISVCDSTLTPPLTQQQSTDNKVRLKLGLGRGSCAVA